MVCSKVIQEDFAKEMGKAPCAAIFRISVVGTFRKMAEITARDILTIEQFT